MKASTVKFSIKYRSSLFLFLVVVGFFIWFSSDTYASSPCANLAGKYLASLDAKTKLLLELRQEECSYGFAKVTTIDERGMAKAECPTTLILDDKERSVGDDLTANAKIDNTGFSGVGKTTYSGVRVNLETKAQLDSRKDLSIDVVAKSTIGLILKRIHMVGVRQSQKFVVPHTAKRGDCSDMADISFLELLLFN